MTNSGRDNTWSTNGQFLPADWSPGRSEESTSWVWQKPAWRQVCLSFTSCRLDFQVNIWMTPLSAEETATVPMSGSPSVPLVNWSHSGISRSGGPCFPRCKQNKLDSIFCNFSQKAENRTGRLQYLAFLRCF